MLSLSNVSVNQAGNYYAKDDYYTQGADSQTRWLGRGAIALNLPTTVQSDDFNALLQGQTPSGQSLHAKRINLKHHRAGTDYTFSAPKSVSIAALIQQDQRVITAHDRAVSKALEIMEQRYVQTRMTTKSGRCKVKTGNLIAAVFRHETSREQDPQLHSHCVVMNATQMADGSWRSLSNEAMIAHQKLLGQIYQNELAYQLRQMGYKIAQKSHGQFELAGYSPELLETFSTRSQAIQNYLDRHEHPDAAQRKQATLKTRKSKPQDLPRDVLLARWQVQLRERELALPDIPSERSITMCEFQSERSRIPRESQSERSGAMREFQSELLENDDKSAEDDSVNAGVNHCSEQRSIFTRVQVERFVLEHHLGQQSFLSLEIAFANHPQLIQMDENRDEYTTQLAVQRELETIRMMQKGQRTVHPIASLAFTQAFTRSFTLTSGQSEAIIGAVTGHDRIMAWQGVAGSGKTYALAQFAQIAIHQGFTLKGYTPSAASAQILQEQTGIPSDTVASLLCANSPVEPLLGKEIWVVDEAGLLNAKDAHELLTRSQQQQARVLLVGDTRQLSAVGAGNPLRSLINSGMTTLHLNQSSRQKTAPLKLAVAAIAAGEMLEGFQQLESAGCVQFSDSRVTQMVRDYVALSTDERDKTLMIAGTNDERSRMTALIRHELQQQGTITADICRLTALQAKSLTTVQSRYTKYYEVGDVIVLHQDYKGQGLVRNQHYLVTDVQAQSITVRSTTDAAQIIDPSHCERKTIYQLRDIMIAVGDRLRWTKNDRKSGIRNGQTFTVLDLDDQGNATIYYDNGATTALNLKSQPFIHYAWVSTVYAAQGKTADRVLALADALISRESFYVTASRAKYELKIYGHDRDELLRRIQISRANPTLIPLYQEVYHAPTSEDSSTRATNFLHCGDAGRDLGASLAAAFPTDCQLRDSLERLNHSTNRNTATITAVTQAITELAERTKQNFRLDDFLATADAMLTAVEQRQTRFLAQARHEAVRQVVRDCQVILHYGGEETPIGRQVTRKSYRITQSALKLKLEARTQNEADYHHVLSYDFDSKQVTTDRSLEQLTAAANYFGPIARKIEQHFEQPKQRQRDVGLEL
jgi:conjugative relaxase-like TrwC/TraI family protein